MAQSGTSNLPPNKQSTWCSDDDFEDAAAAASQDDVPPGHAISSAHHSAPGQARSSRAAANSLMQADADQPPGFGVSHADGVASKQSIAPESVRRQPGNRSQPGYLRQDQRRAITLDRSASQPPLHSVSDSSAPVPAQRSMTRPDSQGGSSSGDDHPPGFSLQRSQQQQSAHHRPAVQSTPPQRPESIVSMVNGLPSRDDHPPGFTQPSAPPTHTQQGNRQDQADQPPGFSQNGSQQKGQGRSVQLSTPASAHGARTRPAKPMALPTPTRGSNNKHHTGRPEADPALSPALPAAATQPLPATSSFSQLLEDHPPGFLAPHPYGRTADSSLAHTPASSSHHPASGDPDMPPGFPTAVAGRFQPLRQGPMGSQQVSADMPQPQKATQAGSQPQVPQQQLHQQQRQLLQAAKQKPTAQGDAPNANHRGSQPPTPSASADGDLPPGFAPQSHLAASTSQPPPKPAQMPPPAGLLARAPQTVTVTRLPSTTTPEQKLSQQPTASASAADAAPPGFAAQLQQPVPASQLPLEPLQLQSPLVAPLRQQKIVRMTKLPTAPSPGPSSGPPVVPPPHVPKIVTVTRLPATPGTRPHAASSATAPKTSSSSRSLGNAQTLPRSPAASLGVSDMPPGFFSMQRSASTASMPAAASQGNASAVLASESVQPSAAQGSVEAPPGFPMTGRCSWWC